MEKSSEEIKLPNISCIRLLWHVKTLQRNKLIILLEYLSYKEEEIYNTNKTLTSDSCNYLKTLLFIFIKATNK